MKLFKPTMVEVTAALEEANDAPIVPKKQENVDLVADEPVKFAVETATKPVVQEASKPQVQISQNTAQNETAIEAKLDNLQNLLEKQMGKEVVNETEEMEEKDENMKFLQLIYNTLLDNEVQEKYANQIIDEISASGKENVSAQNSPINFPRGTTFFSHDLWTWNTLVFFLPLEWLTPAVAATDFLSNPILPAFSLMEILHTTGR